MNQLFYNIAGGIVHQIRREKRTTVSEVIVRGKQNIKQYVYHSCLCLIFNQITMAQEQKYFRHISSL